MRALGAARGLHPAVAAVSLADLVIDPRPVAHTSHPTWGYLLRLRVASAVWAPEFWAWAAGADLMFAEAAGWNRAIRFARGAGGRMAALQVAAQARERRVARLVFAHIGRAGRGVLDRLDQRPAQHR